MSKKKEYPLEVENVFEFEGGTIGYFSRGHHDFAEFASEVKKEFEMDIEPEKCHHWWFRMAICPDNNDSGYTLYYHEHLAPGRGRFPVTVYYL